MGGDEFCVLAPVEPGAPSRRRGSPPPRCSEAGDAFAIGCSYGIALVPSEASGRPTRCGSPTSACTRRRRAASSASRQSTDVLLKVLSERNNELASHLSSVAGLAERIAERLGSPRTRSS